MTAATFTPWRRYGHDRLYVALGDRRLGYRDLKTGADHPDHPTDASLLTALVTRHLDKTSSPGTTPPPVPGEAGTRPAPVPPAAATAPPVPPPALSPAWVDLALNRPGQAARERAEQEWAQRRASKPVRAVLGRMLNVHTDERAWRIGADGEEHVGALLDKMARGDRRWKVLHAVPVGNRGSDIDHLVVCPGGVFTINAKHHPGAKVWVGGETLMVNGNRQPYIRNSRFEATRTARILTAACGAPIAADALVVMFGVEDITIKTEPGEKDGSTVHVKYRRQAVKWLTTRPMVLSEQRIEHIYEIARRSTTWT